MVKKISQLAKMAKPKKKPRRSNIDIDPLEYKKLQDNSPYFKELKRKAKIKALKEAEKKKIKKKVVASRDKRKKELEADIKKSTLPKTIASKRKKFGAMMAERAADNRAIPSRVIEFASFKGKKEAIKRYGKKAVDHAMRQMSKKKIGTPPSAGGYGGGLGSQYPTGIPMTGKVGGAGGLRTTSGRVKDKKTGGKVVKAKKGGGLFGKLASMAKPVKKKIMKATAPKDAKKVGAAQKVTKEVFKLTEPKSRRTQAGIRDTKGRLSGVSKKQKKIASAIRVGVPLAVGASLIPKGDKPKIQTAGASSGGSYKIKSGDTLSQIAKRRGTTLKALLAANPSIKNANKIRVGQTIKMSKPVKKRKSVYQGLSKSRMSKMAMPKKKKMYGGKVVKRDMGGSIGPMNNSKQDMRKERKRKMTAAAKSKYGSSYKGKVKKAIDKVINKKSARTRNETVNKAEKMIKNNPKMFSGRPSSILTEEGFEKVNRKRMGGGKVVKRGKGGSVGSSLVAGCYDT